MVDNDYSFQTPCMQPVWSDCHCQPAQQHFWVQGLQEQNPDLAGELKLSFLDINTGFIPSTCKIVNLIPSVTLFSICRWNSLMLRSCSSRSWCPWTLLQGSWWSESSFGTNPGTFEELWRVKSTPPPKWSFTLLVCLMNIIASSDYEVLKSLKGDAWPFPTAVAVNTSNIISPVALGLSRTFHILLWIGSDHISLNFTHGSGTFPLKSPLLYMPAAYPNISWHIFICLLASGRILWILATGRKMPTFVLVWINWKINKLMRSSTLSPGIFFIGNGSKWYLSTFHPASELVWL